MEPYTEYDDGMVLHLAVKIYHPPCDKTYHGYTAHRCPALVPTDPRAGELTNGVPRWIVVGDHT